MIGSLRTKRTLVDGQRLVGTSYSTLTSPRVTRACGVLLVPGTLNARSLVAGGAADPFV